MKAKRCPACGHRKPLTTDYWHRHKKYGWQSRCKECRKQRLEPKPPGLEPVAQAECDRRWAEGENKAELEQKVSSPVKSLEDLVRVCQIDGETWRVDRWECTAWTTAMRLKGADGAEAPHLEQNYRVWARLVRRVPRALKSVADALLERLASVAPRYPKCSSIRPTRDPHMLEVSIADAHFGKLAWAAETGENYDLRIAERIWRDAVEHLIGLTAGFNLERFCLPLGNDFFNVDGLLNQTTAGTTQDCDGRYAKLVETGNMAALWAVEYLIARAPVHVVLVPGNHDRQTSWHLVQFIKAAFRGNARVTVDDSPAPRKYVRYGSSLLGLTHGNEEKHSSLPALMSTAVPDLWAATTHREWHLGHWHKEKQTEFVSVDTHDGVVVRVLPSISGKDEWHNRKGYMGRRAAEAHLYSRDRGHVGHFVYNVPRA